MHAGKSCGTVAQREERTSDLSEDHAKDVWRSLEMHVFSLGNTPVTEIRPKMLKEHLTPLEEQGILETLRRVISRLNEIFRFAISEELIEFNPADNLVARFKKPKKQNMPALHPSELGRLMLALQNASIRKETRCLIEWELLTWVRPGEAVSARWCDIDMKKAEWRIPDTFMKMNRSHTVPLSKQALRVLQIMEPVSRHRPWVFPSIRKPLEHMHQQTANAALIRMGFGGELVAHGMRSIARTAGAGHFPREVLESALAHQKEMRSKRPTTAAITWNKGDRSCSGGETMLMLPDGRHCSAKKNRCGSWKENNVTSPFVRICLNGNVICRCWKRGISPFCFSASMLPNRQTPCRKNIRKITVSCTTPSAAPSKQRAWSAPRRTNACSMPMRCLRWPGGLLMTNSHRQKLRPAA
jgi:integrase